MADPGNMTRAPSHYSSWTPEDDHQLKAGLAARKGLILTALKLKRTHAAIKQRAAKLGIALADGKPRKAKSDVNRIQRK